VQWEHLDVNGGTTRPDDAPYRRPQGILSEESSRGGRTAVPVVVAQTQGLYRSDRVDGGLEQRGSEVTVIGAAIGGAFRKGDHGVPVAQSVDHGVDNGGKLTKAGPVDGNDAGHSRRDANRRPVEDIGTRHERAR
jgi:hypothetical protein